MGHGIAYAAAISGFKVLMLDLTKKQATRAYKNLSNFRKKFKKALSQVKNWLILKVGLK